MEVHAHSHTTRKKWTHYLWEFIMLFLAVFCGFLAEYQLEHKIEKDREKKYVRSLLKDLEYDTTQYENTMGLIREKIHYYDSVLLFFDRPMDYHYMLPY